MVIQYGWYWNNLKKLWRTFHSGVKREHDDKYCGIRKYSERLCSDMFGLLQQHISQEQRWIHQLLGLILLSIFTHILECAICDTLYITYVVNNGLPKILFPILYPKSGTGGSLHPFLCHFNTDNMMHRLLFSIVWLKRVLWMLGCRQLWWCPVGNGKTKYVRQTPPHSQFPHQ